MTGEHFTISQAQLEFLISNIVDCELKTEWTTYMKDELAGRELARIDREEKEIAARELTQYNEKMYEAERAVLEDLLHRELKAISCIEKYEFDGRNGMLFLQVWVKDDGYYWFWWNGRRLSSMTEDNFSVGKNKGLWKYKSLPWVIVATKLNNNYHGYLNKTNQKIDWANKKEQDRYDLELKLEQEMTLIKEVAGFSVRRETDGTLAMDIRAQVGSEKHQLLKNLVVTRPVVEYHRLRWDQKDEMCEAKDTAQTQSDATPNILPYGENIKAPNERSWKYQNLSFVAAAARLNASYRGK